MSMKYNYNNHVVNLECQKSAVAEAKQSEDSDLFRLCHPPPPPTQLSGCILFTTPHPLQPPPGMRNIFTRNDTCSLTGAAKHRGGGTNGKSPKILYTLVEVSPLFNAKLYKVSSECGNFCTISSE